MHFFTILLVFFLAFEPSALFAERFRKLPPLVKSALFEPIVGLLEEEIEALRSGLSNPDDLDNLLKRKFSESDVDAATRALADVSAQYPAFAGVTFTQTARRLRDMCRENESDLHDVELEIQTLEARVRDEDRRPDSFSNLPGPTRGAIRKIVDLRIVGSRAAQAEAKAIKEGLGGDATIVERYVRAERRARQIIQCGEKRAALIAAHPQVEGAAYVAEARAKLELARTMAKDAPILNRIRTLRETSVPQIEVHRARLLASLNRLPPAMSLEEAMGQMQVRIERLTEDLATYRRLKTQPEGEEGLAEIEARVFEDYEACVFGLINVEPGAADWKIPVREWRFAKMKRVAVLVATALVFIYKYHHGIYDAWERSGSYIIWVMTVPVIVGIRRAAIALWKRDRLEMAPNLMEERETLRERALGGNLDGQVAAWESFESRLDSYGGTLLETYRAHSLRAIGAACNRTNQP